MSLAQRAIAVGPAAPARTARTAMTRTLGRGCRRLMWERGSSMVEEEATNPSRLLRVLAVSAGLVVLGELLLPTAGLAGLLLRLLFALAYPFALLATGFFTRAERRWLARLRHPSEVLAGLQALRPAAAAGVDGSVSEAYEVEQMDEDVDALGELDPERVEAGLREAGHVDDDQPVDEVESVERELGRHRRQAEARQPPQQRQLEAQ